MPLPDVEYWSLYGGAGTSCSRMIFCDVFVEVTVTEFWFFCLMLLVRDRIGVDIFVILREVAVKMVVLVVVADTLAPSLLASSALA